ncbi:uncharacterized protein LOC126851866 [Cataglyphis hispanica]|uniref:uncharacterized protein LOC126851866 n=1 Tax=Cataglyphis hispanica TaxID=1086592 RepID=UPI00217F2E54|nr:uncharacterized protein LOC126851866 [Cataglyphis hispanica]
MNRPKRAIAKPSRYQTTSSEDEAPRHPRKACGPTDADINEDINDLRGILEDNPTNNTQENDNTFFRVTNLFTIFRNPYKRINTHIQSSTNIHNTSHHFTHSIFILIVINFLNSSIPTHKDRVYNNITYNNNIILLKLSFSKMRNNQTMGLYVIQMKWCGELKRMNTLLEKVLKCVKNHRSVPRKPAVLPISSLRDMDDFENIDEVIITPMLHLLDIHSSAFLPSIRYLLDVFIDVTWTLHVCRCLLTRYNCYFNISSFLLFPLPFCLSFLFLCFFAVCSHIHTCSLHARTHARTRVFCHLFNKLFIYMLTLFYLYLLSFFRNYFHYIGGFNLKKTINLCLKEAVKDSLTLSFTWWGREGGQKQLYNASVIIALYEVMCNNQHFPKPTRSEFQVYAKEVLRGAKERARSKLRGPRAHVRNLGIMISGVMIESQKKMINNDN